MCHEQIMNIGAAQAPDRASPPANPGQEFARRLNDALAPLCLAIAARLWMLGPFALVIYFRLNRFRRELESLLNRIAAGAFALPPAAPPALAPATPRETRRDSPRRETTARAPRARSARAAASVSRCDAARATCIVIHVGLAVRPLVRRCRTEPAIRLGSLPRGPPCPSVAVLRTRTSHAGAGCRRAT